MPYHTALSAHACWYPYSVKRSGTPHRKSATHFGINLFNFAPIILPQILAAARARFQFYGDPISSSKNLVGSLIFLACLPERLSSTAGISAATGCGAAHPWRAGVRMDSSHAITHVAPSLVPQALSLCVSRCVSRFVSRSFHFYSYEPGLLGLVD